MTGKVEAPVVAVDAGDVLGESALWSAAEGAVYWVDFYGPTLHRWDPASGARRDWTIPGARTVGSAVLAEDGRLLLALDTGVHLFDPGSGRLEPFADPTAGRAGIGNNDAKPDRQGRYWVGTYDLAETAPTGALYRIGPDGQSHLAAGGFIVCNGPAVSGDGRTLYLSDTTGRRLLACELDPASGRLGAPQIFATIAEDAGLPDGIAVDREGFLWCAHYGGGRLTRYAADGAIDRVLTMPVPNVTSCCFGGPDLDTLYITTAGGEAERRAPGAGALFAARPGLAGLADAPVRLPPSISRAPSSAVPP